MRRNWLLSHITTRQALNSQRLSALHTDSTDASVSVISGGSVGQRCPVGLTPPAGSSLLVLQGAQHTPASGSLHSLAGPSAWNSLPQIHMHDPPPHATESFAPMPLLIRAFSKTLSDRHCQPSWVASCVPQGVLACLCLFL